MDNIPIEQSVEENGQRLAPRRGVFLSSMVESFSVTQTDKVVQVEKISHPPSMDLIPKDGPEDEVVGEKSDMGKEINHKIKPLPYKIKWSMIVERETTYTKKSVKSKVYPDSFKDAFTTSIIFNEITTVFKETAENWIAKVHRISKKTIGPKGEVLEEKFNLKKEINDKNEYMKNYLADMKNGSKYEDVSRSALGPLDQESTSSNEKSEETKPSANALYQFKDKTVRWFKSLGNGEQENLNEKVSDFGL